VKNPADGQVFATRAGNFRIDDSGYLVTYQGYRVQGATGGTSAAAPSTVGDIKLGTPPTGAELSSFSISSAGNLTEFYSDNSSVTTNQVLLQNYSDPSALMKQGDNLYTSLTTAGIIGPSTPTVATNAPAGNGLGTIQVGTLELANVDLTNEFANMITAQRSFQASSRLITVSDSVLQDVVDLKRS
jgi:flagellar hook protein FlgE